jgi:hypothetical protein
MAVLESSGSLSNGAVAVSENYARREIIFCNTSDTVMTVRIGGSTATAAIGIPVPAGTALRLDGQDSTGRAIYGQAMSLFCAGATKTYAIYETL